MKIPNVLLVYRAYKRHVSGDYRDGLGFHIFTETEMLGLIACETHLLKDAFSSEENPDKRWQMIIDNAFDLKKALLEHNEEVRKLNKADVYY